MLGKRRWISIALIALLAVFGLSAAAGADSGSEGEFLAKINATRSANGLGALTMDGSLRSHARTHTQDMIAAGNIYHSSNAELQAAAGSGWSKLGENVGRGGSVDSLHNAFMNSPGHRANILGDYNYVGIGTGTNPDGVLYVTVVFMKKGSTEQTTTTTQPPATTTTAPAGTTTKAPSPKPAPQATTTTTIPPATTTTLMVGPDKPVTPGESCVSVTQFWWMCHD